MNKSILPAYEYSESIGGTAWLEKIFSMARICRGVFSRVLHCHPFSRRRTVDSWLRLRVGQIDRPAECPAGVLFRAGDGISLLRAAIVFFLAHLQCRRDRVVAGVGVLGRVVR